MKLHTVLDLRGDIPSFIYISDGKLHDVNILDQIGFEPGSFYIMDWGYIDFGRLDALFQAQALFVVRAKSNMQFERVYSRSVDKATGLRCDQTIKLTGAINHPVSCVLSRNIIDGDSPSASTPNKIVSISGTSPVEITGIFG